MKKLKIIVGGYIGLYPTGGATLDYIQYPLGLKMLGHDVYYIEDTMQYPLFQQKGMPWDNADGCVEYVKKTMEYFGFRDNWAYRDIASGQCFGMSLSRVLAICKSADIFINLSCSTVMRDEYYNIPGRILIDTDPMFTQVTCLDELKAGAKTCVKKLIETHNYLFSFGENIGEADCLVPTLDLNWISTRQPVCLDLWNKPNVKDHQNFTTVMNWSGREKLIYNDEEWGQKDVEFEKFLKIPLSFPDIKFSVVINPPLNNSVGFNIDKIKANKWQVLHPKDTVSDPPAYTHFIQNSFAEFSVAKEAYVKSKSGWFSCRSACYLASGRPVIAQETGWSKYIDSGGGLFTFHNIESATEAVKVVAGDEKKHSKVAVEIANSFFDSKKVLSEMIHKLN